MKHEDVGKVIDRSFQAQSFIDTHAHRITDHYLHAREKHPYFCDRLIRDNRGISYTIYDFRRDIDWLANDSLDRLKYAEEKRILEWSDILNCRTSQVVKYIANGDKAQAVEELYDAIAVCLRAIDVIEGRQKLGKPKTIAEKYAEVRQRKESGEPHSPPMSARAQVQAMVEN